MEGSLSRQCDKTNGSCLCRKGITGYSCSRCDRGTTGNIPYCTPCGECYDNWADVLNEIKSNFLFKQVNDNCQLKNSFQQRSIGKP